ncbi:MAG TPA: HEAT repeat domain-containing protein [Thermomicrobiales bacterium]|nr:HEAT repeat domain-containing protein [Thermomicrobiales bacterium]
MPQDHNDELDENMHIFSLEETGESEDEPVDLEEDAYELYAATTGPGFEAALDAIQEDTVEPVMLTGFSGMDRNQARQLKKVWASLPDDARQPVADLVLSLGMDDLLLDFKRFFRLMIDDTLSEVREAGANGLAMDEDEDLIDPLLKLMGGDPVTRVRGAAAQALATYTTLGEFMELPDSTVRKMRNALMAIVNDASLASELRAAALASAAVQTGDKEIVRAIERFSKSDDQDLRLGAYQAMGRAGDRLWVKHLDAASRSQDPDIRAQAARALGAFEEEVVPILTMLVREDTEPAVRTDAIDALGRVGGKRALDALQKLRPYVSDDERGLVDDALVEAQEWADLEDLEDAFEDDPDIGAW